MTHKIRACFCAGALVAFSAQAAALEKPVCKSVQSEWMWFSDPIAISTDYAISFELNQAVTAFGRGALHIRSAESGSVVKICVSAGDLKPITFTLN